jgi:hypothetical protein
MYCSDVAHASGGAHRPRFDRIEEPPDNEGLPRDRGANVVLGSPRSNAATEISAVASWLDPVRLPPARARVPAK